MRPRAAAVLTMLAATLALGIVLLIFFEPEIQTIDADELVARKDDARAFLAADYLFIVFYAILSPLAAWRFGSALTGGSPPGWIMAAALLLVAAGLVDLGENTLLLSSTGSVSEGTVDAAHALQVPKVALFAGGTLLALAVNVRAAKALRDRG